MGSTTIVNDMGSHRVHTTHVPERCSNLAWWWLFTAETCRLKVLL